MAIVSKVANVIISDRCIFSVVSWPAIKGKLFRLFIKLPYIRGIAAKEMDGVDKAIVSQCRSIYQGEKFLVELPTQGLKQTDILEKFKKYQGLSKVNWRNGRASGTFVN